MEYKPIQLDDPKLRAAADRVDARMESVGDQQSTMAPEQIRLLFAGMDVSGEQLGEILLLTAVQRMHDLATVAEQGEPGATFQMMHGIVINAFLLGWEVRDGQA